MSDSVNFLKPKLRKREIPVYRDGERILSADEVRERLSLAIAAYAGDAGPGVWGVEEASETSPGMVEINYTVYETEKTVGLAQFVYEQDNNYLLQECGGDNILAAANLCIADEYTTWGDLNKVDGQTQFVFTAYVRTRLTAPFTKRTYIN